MCNFFWNERTRSQALSGNAYGEALPHGKPGGGASCLRYKAEPRNEGKRQNQAFLKEKLGVSVSKLPIVSLVISH